ncbi:DUF4257 domain-containing protein [Bacillus sp. DJP31]|uniref:DUF4257 domain-containing protein n=1 Tax=Bacillus sp. DJP31 TaxID=3409789 RepID=UPI003BB6659E
MSLTVMNIFIVSLTGALTGMVAHLIRNERILLFPKRRHRPKGIDLGFIADLLASSLAALFANTYLFAPTDIGEMIGIAVMAGMAAESILLQKEIRVERTKTEELEKISRRISEPK